jgi:hypothetical protein
MIGLAAGANGLKFDPGVGNLPDLWFGAAHPLHVAPWHGQAHPGLPLVEQYLAGDFLCMPFGAADVTGDPPHGLTANSPWRIVERTEGADAARLEVELEARVMGARVRKTLALSAEAPVLVTLHEITGGQGGVTLAHHPMIRVRAGDRICTSPKSVALSADKPLEPGRNWLEPGRRATDPARFPGVTGEADLGRYPAQDCEDFVTLVEAPGRDLGWTAVLRAAEDDIVFVLKRPAELPLTMLWFSNGGRDYAPWSGRHRGVLGIEDGRAAGASGHAAALGRNRVADEGVETTLPLAAGRRHLIHHAIGAVPRPRGWTSVADIRIEGRGLRLAGQDGSTVSLPMPAAFFEA